MILNGISAPVKRIDLLSWTPAQPTTSGGVLPIRWWDFSDISTLYTDTAKTTPVTADGDTIGAAEDKAGVSDLAQTNATIRPTYKTGIINSLSIARFAADRLKMDDPAVDIAVTGGIHLLMVFQTSSTTTNRALFSRWTATDEQYLLQLRRGGGGQETAFITRNAADTAQYTASDGVTHYGDGLVHLAEGSWDGSTIYLYVDTSLIDSTPAADVNTATIDTFLMSYAGVDTDGDVGEVLIYNDNLSAADRAELETYLNNKWNIY